MDVKYVPTACYAGTDGEKFYQYTLIEEASRERLIYAYSQGQVVFAPQISTFPLTALSELCVKYV